MDLKDLLKEYWPIVVGVVVVLLTAVIFWPSDELAQQDEEELVPIGISSTPRQAEEPRGLSNRAEPATTKRDVTVSEKKPESGEPTYEFLEIVNAVPTAGPTTPGRVYKTDDPEVRRALSQVEVTLYVEDECDACTRAREYLEKNGVLVTTRNVETDAGQRERARRLSGTRSLPVLVVDGKVLSGFSEGPVQVALTDAVKTRVISDVQKQPNP